MNPYMEQEILGAAPVELVKIIYQRAISCVREARQHLGMGRIAERSAAISSAHRALSELLVTLRPEAAPELGFRLQALYLYMQQRLIDANLRQSDAPLAEVLGLLTILSEAWTRLADEKTNLSEKRQSDSTGRDAHFLVSA
jgi:flagellar protein FliS